MVRLKIMLIILIGLVVFSSCGKDQDSSKNGTTSTTTEESSTENGENDNPKNKKKEKEDPYKNSNIDFEVVDKNYNGLFEMEEPLIFELRGAINSINTDNILWKFGNGDTDTLLSPIYSYDKEAKYLVSLYVDDIVVREKILTIHETIPSRDIDTVVTIYGPAEGYINQDIVFRAHGTGVTEWYWEFGEVPGLVSTESSAQVVHRYLEEGRYKVKVTTDLSEYPTFHNIEIFDGFVLKVDLEEPVDTVQICQDDIKEHLQIIADASISDYGTYKREMEYISDNYICDLKELVVVINGSRYNDFRSYCQGIHHLDSKDDENVIIQEVIIDTIKCMTRLEVSQIKASETF